MKQKHHKRKYSNEQYALAELMLTHGTFTIAQIARVTRMADSTVEELSRGATMQDIYFDGSSDDDEDDK